uniref:Orf86 n=1 Tax=Acavomonas peruviana TaxID=1542312 RepID=V5KVK3_9ALVE|nr:orf86 [Acavomonas peruviana]
MGKRINQLFFRSIYFKKKSISYYFNDKVSFSKSISIYFMDNSNFIYYFDNFGSYNGFNFFYLLGNSYYYSKKFYITYKNNLFSYYY